MKKILLTISLILIAVLGFGNLFKIQAYDVDLIDKTSEFTSNFNVNSTSVTFTSATLTDGWYLVEINHPLRESPLPNYAEENSIITQTETLFTLQEMPERIRNGTFIPTKTTIELKMISGQITLKTPATWGYWGLTEDSFKIYYQFKNDSSYVYDEVTTQFTEVNYNSENTFIEYDTILPDGLYYFEYKHLISEYTTESNVLTANPSFIDGEYTTNLTTFYAEIIDGNILINLIQPRFKVTDFNIYSLVPSSPSFNYSELTLEVPYYDIPTLSEVQSMLSASDGQDGDLTDQIQLVSENITDFQVGDPLNNIVEIFTSSSTTYSTPYADLQNYSFIYEVSSEKYIVNIPQAIIDYGYNNEVGSMFFVFNPYEDSYEFVEDNSSDYFLLKNDQSITQQNIFNWVDKLYIIDETIESYQAIFSVEDSSGNISYLTVNYDIYNDKVGEFTYSDELNDISVSLYSTDISKEITIDIKLTDYLSNISTKMSGISIISDYDSVYNTSFDTSMITGLSNTITISGNTGVSELDFNIPITINFNIIDDISPSFDGSANYITVDYNNLISHETLLSYLELSDETDDNLDLIVTKVFDNYTTNYNELGRYEVIYSATDTSGNTSYHTIVLFVIDQTPPLYFVDESFIVVSINDPINQQDLDDILIAHGIVSDGLGFTVTVLSEDYFDNSTEVGLYTMRLRIDYEDDTYEIIELSLETIEQPVPEQPILNFDNLTNIQKALGLTLSTGLLVAVALLIFRKKR